MKNIQKKLNSPSGTVIAWTWAWFSLCHREGIRSHESAIGQAVEHVDLSDVNVNLIEHDHVCDISFCFFMAAPALSV